MKRCPECRRDYYDDTLLYCLEDGNALVQGSVPPPQDGPDEPATAILSEPGAISTGLRDGDATRAQVHTTDQTAIFPRDAEAKPQESIGKISERHSFSANRAAKPLIVAVVVVVVLAGGFLGYRYITPAKQIESIAVMPFVNESGNADAEFLSDGMTETLIGSLSQIPNLNVKARSSVFRYKGQDYDLPKIARELKVQAILSGRVLQRGEQVVLALELVDVATENVIWSESYTRKQSDLTTLQSDIARDVSNKLRTRLSGVDQSQIAKNYTTNAEAYQLYLKGRYYWNKRTREDINRGIEYFNQAIAADPGYALAYSGLADAWVVLPSFANKPPPETAYANARAAAHKALEIDPELAEPHAALAVILHEADWNFPEAEKEYRKAIEMDPNYASAHQWYGEYLKHMGRFDEAIAESKRAQELEPLSVIINMMLGRTYFAARRFDDAIAQYHKTLEIDPEFDGVIFSLSEAYAAKGMYNELMDIDRRFADDEGVPADEANRRDAEMRDAYKKFGSRGYWSKSLELAEQDARKRNLELPPSVAAFLHVQIGNNEQALSFLESALQRNRYDKTLLTLKVHPVWDPVRAEPRFQEIMHKIGLPL